MTQERGEPNSLGRTDIKSIINAFVNIFLPLCIEKGGKLKPGDTHVVFSYGTVVRFNVNDLNKVKEMNTVNEIKDVENWNYTPENDDYPKHRVSKDLDILFEKYKTIYKHTLEKNPAHTNTIKGAYKKLIENGYPYPGGSGADSLYLEMCDHENEQLICTIFPELGDIMTLGLTKNNDIEGEHHTTRECRRMDYMTPRIVAIVDSDCKIIDIENN